MTEEQVSKWSTDVKWQSNMADRNTVENFAFALLGYVDVFGKLSKLFTS